MTLNFLKKGITIIWLLCSTISLCSAQHSFNFKTGMVIDSLAIPSSNTTFSIYLPTTFDPNKNWPILLGFDSSGKASTITHLYKAAAEEQGYIVAISNFSEDLQEKKKNNYVTTFIHHIFSLLPIQKNRVYATAIHESAKLVSLLPVFYANDIFGVHVIGDSYFYDSSIKIRKTFSYLGTVHIHNFRYKDFLKNKDYLKRKAVRADIFSYEGTSELPDTNLLSKALSTFTLHAMAAGRMAKDSLWIQNLYQQNLKQIETNLANSGFLEAFDEVKRIRENFKSFFNTDHLKTKQKEIKKRKEYKKQKRLQNKYLYRENFLRLTYLFSLDEDVELNSYENLDWWQYQVSELDSLVTKKEKYASAMGYRMKGYLTHLVHEYKMTHVEERKNFEKILFLNILSTIVDKKDFDSYRTIISMSAVDQDYETALFYLEKLLQNGYQDFEKLYDIEGTLALKMSKEYNKLIKKHLGKSKFFFSE